MILHGIEVTKFKWNDKEVSEEEYQRLDLEWKAQVEKSESSQEPPGKNPGTQSPPGKKFRNPNLGPKKIKI